MRVARTQNEKSVVDIVARAYGIRSDDPRADAAARALVAVNPVLKDPTRLPAGTPLVVPDVAGLSAASAPASDPRPSVWIGVLDRLVESAQQGSIAQAIGQAGPAVTPTEPPRAPALQQLEKDVAQFRGLHGAALTVNDR